MSRGLITLRRTIWLLREWEPTGTFTDEQMTQALYRVAGFDPRTHEKFREMLEKMGFAKFNEDSNTWEDLNSQLAEYE